MEDHTRRWRSAALVSVRERARRFGSRFWKFSTVGVGNALIDVGTLNLLLWLFPVSGSLRIATYNILALGLANANSYLWNSLWTFREKADGNLGQRLLFVAQALVNMAANAGLFWLIIHVMLDYTSLSQVIAGNLAKVLSTTVAFTASFFLLRHVVFSRKLSRKREPAQDPQRSKSEGEAEAKREAEVEHIDG